MVLLKKPIYFLYQSEATDLLRETIQNPGRRTKPDRKLLRRMLVTSDPQISHTARALLSLDPSFDALDNPTGMTGANPSLREQSQARSHLEILAKAMYKGGLTPGKIASD